MRELPEIVSPCISVCKIDPESGWCRGCFRSRDEIAIWSAADRNERLAILACLRERRRAAGITGARDRRRLRSREPHS